MMKFKIAIFLVSITSVFLACDDPSIENSNSTQIQEFLNTVSKNAAVINGIKLGDSWRVVREQASYWDGSTRKEFDENWLESDECPDFKQYWIFDRDKVMQAYKGNCYDKDWTNYSEIFTQQMDLENELLTINYIYDDGEKAYTRYWKISVLTETELVLTDEDVNNESFYQYTFRREQIK